MNFIKTDCGRSEAGFTERSDCTVRAAAAALGISYRDAHAKLKALGRKDGRSFKFRAHIETLGMERREDLCAMRLEKALPEMQAGRFVVYKAGHVFAVINGVVIDLKAPKPSVNIRMVYQVK